MSDWPDEAFNPANWNASHADQKEAVAKQRRSGLSETNSKARSVLYCTIPEETHAPIKSHCFDKSAASSVPPDQASLAQASTTPSKPSDMEWLTYGAHPRNSKEREDFSKLSHKQGLKADQEDFSIFPLSTPEEFTIHSGIHSDLSYDHFPLLFACF